MNHTCLFLPSRRWSSFTDPWRMEGWVGLGGWLHTEMNVRHREVNSGTVTHPSTITGPDGGQLRWSRPTHYRYARPATWTSQKRVVTYSRALLSQKCISFGCNPRNGVTRGGPSHYPSRPLSDATDTVLISPPDKGIMKRCCTFLFFYRTSNLPDREPSEVYKRLVLRLSLKHWLWYLANLSLFLPGGGGVGVKSP